MDASDRAGAVANWGQLTEKFLAVGDSMPRNTLLQQVGLQLAEACFYEKQRCNA